MGLLEDIAAKKQQEVQRLDFGALKIELTRRLKREQDGEKGGLPPTRSLIDRLQKQFGIVAEIKRKSPSAGVMKESLRPEEIAENYEEAGAAAISVLTDETWFGGSLQDLADVRRVSSLPLLRKDFTVDRRQLYEARLLGADLVLLIVRMLSPADLKAFHEESREIGLEILVEVHDQRDLDKAHQVLDPIPILGINNRNLDTLTIDLQRCLDMKSDLPPHTVAIAESGLKTEEDCLAVKNAGYQGALIGQVLMQHPDPPAMLARLSGV